MTISRRDTITGCLTFSAGFLAGCTGGSPVDTGDGGGGGSNRQQIIDSREEVAEDEYQYFTFDLNRQATLEYEFYVRNGPEVEVFVMDDQEFDEYQGRNRFRTYSQEGGTSGSDTLTLAEDSYRLVVDNTDGGNVQPPTNFDDDVAEVEVKAWVEG